LVNNSLEGDRAFLPIYNKFESVLKEV
jgi:hypothetical protein